VVWKANWELFRILCEGGSEQAADPAPFKYRRRPIYSPSEWLFEGMSSLLAMVIVITIAVIFWMMDGKPLKEWSGPVSLAATISILTTAYSSALMHSVSSFIRQLKWLHFKDKPRRLSHLETFDEASRGVWGALLLLTNVKWNLATLGAIITILRLTFSAFSQQAVQIAQRASTTPSDINSVAFGYAHNYSRDFSNFSTYGNTDKSKGISTFQNITEAIPQDPDMQFAIIKGLYGIDTPATFSCPSSCRWDGSYVSLGFKSACKNVKQDTLRSAACDGTEHRNRCNMTTPNGVNIITHRIHTDAATSYVMNTTSTLEPSAEEKLLEIARFGIYRSSPDGNFRQQNVSITQCSLYLTAYEYANAFAKLPTEVSSIS
jgi:hypothetical protein